MTLNKLLQFRLTRATASIAAVFDRSIAFARWRLYAPSPNTWFFGPTRVYSLNCISVGLVVFTGLTVFTNRQTDTRTNHSIRSICPHLCTACVRYGLELYEQTKHSTNQRTNATSHAADAVPTVTVCTAGTWLYLDEFPSLGAVM